MVKSDELHRIWHVPSNSNNVLLTTLPGTIHEVPAQSARDASVQVHLGGPDDGRLPIVQLLRAPRTKLFPVKKNGLSLARGLVHTRRHER